MDDNNENKNGEKDLLEIKNWGQRLNVKAPKDEKQKWQSYNSAQILRTIRKTAPWWGVVAALLVGIYIGRVSQNWVDHDVNYAVEKKIQQDETFESVYSNY
ncbi:MAG: hypothetical protein L6Q37_09490 [Bdellovibrionaceae bacterium]|nr:hypothetical protein [Pseudobdellovibrionaceae bacterium]NUM59213.1 hypothetical protein [Pseudobdellovibrionaceae bacterium]